MELLDTSIANVSLPYIAGGLGRSFDEVTWILTTYWSPMLLSCQ
jgi:DHA2 family multidrug resistance protein